MANVVSPFPSFLLTQPPGIPVEDSNSPVALSASAANKDYTVGTQILAGSLVVAPFFFKGSGLTLSSVSDTRSNPWGIDVQRNAQANNVTTGIASCILTTTLQVNDVIHFTQNSTAFNGIDVAVFTIPNGATGLNVSGHMDESFVASVTAPATTTIAAVTCLGIITVVNTNTYGSGNWTQVGSTLNDSGFGDLSYWVYTVLSATGSQDPGGAPNAAADTCCIWGAYS